MFFLLVEQRAVFIERPLGDPGQGLFELPACQFVSYGLQGAMDRLGPEVFALPPGLKRLIP